MGKVGRAGLNRLPSQAAGLLLDVAGVDGSGRVSAGILLRVLRWPPGHRVHIGVERHLVVISSGGTGRHLVGGRGELPLPVAARRMCGIWSGQAVLLAASVPRSVLLVHSAAMVAQLLTGWYATLLAGSESG